MCKFSFSTLLINLYVHGKNISSKFRYPNIEFSINITYSTKILKLMYFTKLCRCSKPFWKQNWRSLKHSSLCIDSHFCTVHSLCHHILLILQFTFILCVISFIYLNFTSFLCIECFALVEYYTL